MPHSKQKKLTKHGSRSALSDAAAKLSTLKLAPMSGRGRASERASERARQRRGKLSRHYSNSVFVSPSPSCPDSLRCLPSLPHTHLLANGIALYSRKFVRGDSFVRRARPDPRWRRRTRAGGELWPGAEGRNPRGEVAALWAVTSQLHTKPKSRWSRTCTGNLSLTLLKNEHFLLFFSRYFCDMLFTLVLSEVWSGISTKSQFFVDPCLILTLLQGFFKLLHKLLLMNFHIYDL